MSRTFVTTLRSATKLFGPTSCSAKRSDLDLFLPKVRYVRKKVQACVGKERAAKKTKVRSKKTKVRLEKTQGHWRVRSLAFPGETNAFAFALHLERFSHGQSYFSFSKKIYGSRMGSRMRSRIGSGIGSRFGVQKGGPRFVNTQNQARTTSTDLLKIFAGNRCPWFSIWLFIYA